MSEHVQGRVGMRPSDTQIAAEKKRRLVPLRDAVKAFGADLDSEEITDLVKAAVTYRPTTVADISQYTDLSEEEIQQHWGEIIANRP